VERIRQRLFKMNQSGRGFVPYYKTLRSYQLSEIAFEIGWKFVPLYYDQHEDARQRDQIKQALRSFKQNIVEERKIEASPVN